MSKQRAWLRHHHDELGCEGDVLVFSRVTDEVTDHVTSQNN